MAKKRRKEKEDDSYEFQMPEFDEEEYLRKEVRDSKVLFITFIYAILIGLVSFGVSLIQPSVAILIGLVSIVFLRHIYPFFKIDTSLLDKKQWGSNIIMYLFAWLAIWILLSNPPFSDLAAPTINDQEYYVGSPGNWTLVNETIIPEVNMNLSIQVTVVDNVKVDTDSVHITLFVRQGDDFIEFENGTMEKIGKNKYAYVLFDIDQGLHKFEIRADDVNDHRTSKSGTFNVV